MCFDMERPLHISSSEKIKLQKTMHYSTHIYIYIYTYVCVCVLYMHGKMYDGKTQNKLLTVATSRK